MREAVRFTLPGGRARALLLRPSWEAYGEIETAIEASLPQIYRGHALLQLRLRDTAQIVAIGANAHTPGSAEVESVERRLYELGPAADGPRAEIGRFLLALMYAPEEARKKAAEEWPATAAEEAAASGAAAHSSSRSSGSPS
ncbi:MAG: hypothetical protein AAFR16_00725 [Pseudomonadota bacterium]